ncbi:MAG: hypothetical protein HKM89_12890 [Gemmatimonadales bacterium]|nr:hypothetical protein [Gemmatimonadales bacterium]
MPIVYTIDSDNGLVLTKATGILTDAEVAEHKRALMADPDFRPGMRELSDVRSVERLDITRDGVRRFAALDEIHSPQLGDYKLAMVASADVV